MILVIDNYDSFVHNLTRYFERLGVRAQVVRNDAITVAEVRRLAPQAVVFSPGPCTPNEAGCSLQLVRELVDTTPMLGVCLGHQAIAQALGGRVVRAARPWHGRSSSITHSGDGVFAGLPRMFEVGRYHSLVVEPETLPAELEPTAWTADGVLMAFEHRTRPVVGLQFHPESILTEHGFELLANFLRLAGVECLKSASDLAQEQLAEIQTPMKLPDRPVTF